MFLAALFVIAKYWIQSQCPSVGEWLNKLWYFHTVELWEFRTSHPYILACREFQAENSKSSEGSRRNFGLPPYYLKEFKLEELLQEGSYHRR